MFKKMNQKLHSFLFPRQSRRISYLETLRKELYEEHSKLQDQIAILKKKEELPKPTMAHLMRETLGVNWIDFTNIVNGQPKHFLDVEPDKRASYIAQLSQIHRLEVWSEMLKYHFDLQGNFIAREADGEMQVLCGRMTINGISLLRDEVKKGFDEYVDGRKPPEDFDPNEVNEGIIINEIIEKQNGN